MKPFYLRLKTHQKLAFALIFLQSIFSLTTGFKYLYFTNIIFGILVIGFCMVDLVIHYNELPRIPAEIESTGRILSKNYLYKLIIEISCIWIMVFILTSTLLNRMWP